MLPSLLRKAIGDAGFDLILGADAEWARVGVSGLAATAWILPVEKGALLALAEPAVLREFDASTWTEVPLPRHAVGAVRCHTPGELYGVLRRVRMLFAQLPPAPQKRFAARLAAIGSTEADAIVKQRVGQTLFREMLMDYWDGRCAVTGLAMPELLRASHAKPWKDSTDGERLDVYNGLLLAVHLDALFDQGFMTFTPDGTARFSRHMTPEVLRVLVGGPNDVRLSRTAEGHRPYLDYHVRRVFRGPDAIRAVSEPVV